MKKFFTYSIDINFENFYFQVIEKDLYVIKENKNAFVACKSKDYSYDNTITYFQDINSVITDNPVKHEYDGYIEISICFVYNEDDPENKINDMKKLYKEKVDNMFRQTFSNDIFEYRNFINKIIDTMFTNN